MILNILPRSFKRIFFISRQGYAPAKSVDRFTGDAEGLYGDAGMRSLSRHLLLPPTN